MTRKMWQFHCFETKARQSWFLFHVSKQETGKMKQPFRNSWFFANLWFCFFSEKQKKTRKLLTLYFQLMARSNAPHRSRLTSSVYVIWVSTCNKFLIKLFIFPFSCSIFLVDMAPNFSAKWPTTRDGSNNRENIEIKWRNGQFSVVAVF